MVSLVLMWLQSEQANGADVPTAQKSTGLCMPALISNGPCTGTASVPDSQVLAASQRIKTIVREGELAS